MPMFGGAMESGEISQWFKKEGDVVKKGDQLCEIESDKVTNILDAYENGILEKIIVKEGESAPIGEPIAILRQD